jgi:hypothetical protein
MRSTHVAETDSSQLVLAFALEVGLAALAFGVALGLSSWVRGRAQRGTTPVTIAMEQIRAARTLLFMVFLGVGAYLAFSMRPEGPKGDGATLVWLMLLPPCASIAGTQLVLSRMQREAVGGPEPIQPQPARSGRTPLWVFAHEVLATQFHLDPAHFLRTLDGPHAPKFLEWAWQQAGAPPPPDPSSRPPLLYGIDQPRPDLSVIWFRFHGVTRTGEPHHARFIVCAPGPGYPGYARAFYLEHSEMLSGPGRRGAGLVCETAPGGVHLNLATILPVDDEEGFDRVVVEHVSRTASARPPANPAWN